MAGSNDSSMSTVSVTPGPESGADVAVVDGAVVETVENEDDVTALLLLREECARKGVKDDSWSLEKGISHGCSMGMSRSVSAVVVEDSDGPVIDADVEVPADGDPDDLLRGELAATAAGRFDAAHAANSSRGASVVVAVEFEVGPAVEVADADAEVESVEDGASILAAINPDRMG